MCLLHRTSHRYPKLISREVLGQNFFFFFFNTAPGRHLNSFALLQHTVIHALPHVMCKLVTFMQHFNKNVFLFYLVFNPIEVVCREREPSALHLTLTLGRIDVQNFMEDLHIATSEGWHRHVFITYTRLFPVAGYKKHQRSIFTDN